LGKTRGSDELYGGSHQWTPEAAYHLGYYDYGWARGLIIRAIMYRRKQQWTRGAKDGSGPCPGIIDTEPLTSSEFFVKPGCAITLT